MAIAKKKGAAARKKGAAARSKAAKSSKLVGTFDELVGLQQKLIGNVAAHWATAATRIADGDFEVRTWFRDCTGLWRGMLSDFADTLNSVAAKSR